MTLGSAEQLSTKATDTAAYTSAILLDTYARRMQKYAYQSTTKCLWKHVHNSIELETTNILDDGMDKHILAYLHNGTLSHRETQQITPIGNSMEKSTGVKALTYCERNSLQIAYLFFFWSSSIRVQCLQSL